MCGPAAVLAWFVVDLWDRFKDSPWRRAIQRAIAPIVVAMILSGGVVLATPDATIDWRLWLIAAATAAGILATKAEPALVPRRGRRYRRISAFVNTWRSRDASIGTASARYFLKCGVAWCASNAFSLS